jgi:dephospho-CoA kinase
MRVALTGGIASGKSTVAEQLRALGATIIDADLLARAVVAAGTSGLDEVVDRFGGQVLTAEGELDRPAVARLVFNDDAARRDLEGIIHPRVYEESRRLEEQAPAGALVVHDIPLLAESGRVEEFHAVLVVDTPVELQVARMVEDRGWTREEAESRIAAQTTREERREIATHLIDNSGTVAELETRVREIYDELMGRAGT